MEYLCTAVLLIMSCACVLVNNDRKKRKWWVRPWILKRDEKGAFSLVNEEFEAADDTESFKGFLRMDKETFEKLLSLVKEDIMKEATHLRVTILAKSRLILTLRFLATGESFRSLQFTFRIGLSTISRIIPEVCTAICRKLIPIYVKVSLI